MASSRQQDHDKSNTNGTDDNNNKTKTLFNEERHRQNELSFSQPKVDQWRMKDRMKTVSVALVICLNIGVDPPDVIKTTPCARLECWVDPHALPPQKAVDTIGKTLQMQYERWQPRARYKLCLDPTADVVKKLCGSLRRNAKEERALFHYNGHGVPKPTENGEIWVFNKDYTQYIPLSIYDLQQWLQSPCIYVFDCNCAGLVIKHFNRFVEQRLAERIRSGSHSPNTPPEDHILLAACGETETLPTNPDLPADIFTSCLTTPIKMALKWFVSQTIISGISLDLIDHIPGKLNDRRTPLGELNWIFTAVTDTIAWHVLPRPLFQKLFRQDLLVACLFRNFLLAERIMRSCRCTPVSSPKLPPTYNHPMWQAWDLAADYCLAQLPKLIANPNAEFKHCTFFTEQLTAFEVWLEFGANDKKPPEQLPIVLQVLLSQQHRLRALVLLGKFLDLGPWAVNQGLSVGIFPYVLKLLQSPAVELREVLVFIWAKILAVDKSCRNDLVKESGHSYFVSVLSNPKVPSHQRTQTAFILSVICHNDAKLLPGQPVPASNGQSVCLAAKLINICLSLLADQDASLRQWVVFCLAKLWENYEEAKEAAVQEKAHERLCALLTDPVPEVRAAAVYALGTFVSGDPTIPRSASRTDIEFNISITLPVVMSDSSPMVRRELAISLTHLVHTYYDHFVDEVKRQLRVEYAHYVRRQNTKKDESTAKTSSGAKDSGQNKTSVSISVPTSSIINNSGSVASSPMAVSPSGASEHQLLMAAFAGNLEEHSAEQQSGVYDFIWKLLRSLASDPVASVFQVAQHVIRHVRETAKQQHIQTLTAANADVSMYMDTLSLKKSASLVPEPKDSKQAKSPAKKELSNSQSSVPSNASSNNGSKLFQSTSTISSSLSSSSIASTSSSSTNGPKKSSSNTTSRLSSGLASLLPRGSTKQLPTGAPGTPMNISDESVKDTSPNTSDDSVKGTLLDDRDSSLYDRACLYFATPIYKPHDDDETASDYSERHWRQHRNDHMLKEAYKLYSDRSSAVPRKIEHEIVILENECQMVSSVLFHPFEPIVVVADEAKGITVWNWEEGSRVNKIENRSVSSSISGREKARITSLSLLNEHDIALIAAGSVLTCLWVKDDGIVRIWNGIHGGQTKLVTAWRALADAPSLGGKARGIGLVLEWQQKRDIMLATGNVGMIRVWDLNKELPVLNIQTAADSAVTCLTSDKQDGGHLVYAGFADGVVKLYDLRMHNAPTAVLSFNELKSSPVVSVSKPQCCQELIAGATNGIIKFWDVRAPTALTTIGTALPAQSAVNAMVVHDHIPMIATGSQDSKIKVMNLKGEEISAIRYHDGFLGQRIGSVSCLAFHPYHALLGAGAMDSLISIYAETFRPASN